MDSLKDLTADYLLKKLPIDCIDILTNKLQTEVLDLTHQLESLKNHNCFADSFGLCFNCRKWACKDHFNCDTRSLTQCHECKLFYCSDCVYSEDDDLRVETQPCVGCSLFICSRCSCSPKSKVKTQPCVGCSLFICSRCSLKSKVKWFNTGIDPIDAICETCCYKKSILKMKE